MQRGRTKPIVTDAGMPAFGALTPGKRAGNAASARTALPLLLELVPDVQSMVQVGFGGGEWLAEARRLGVPEVLGVDGPWAPRDDLLVEPGLIAVVDVRQELTLDRVFDLAICTEYAEHLPEERAASFVADLCGLAPVVAFSAAIPGQGGVGHVNEQWPDYWEDRFAAVGYRLVDAVRRRLWREPGGPAYLAQNLFLAVDAQRLDAYPRLAESARADTSPVLALVHPKVLEHRLRSIPARDAVRALRTTAERRARQALRLPPRRRPRV